jgi:hypothetical protein
MALQHGSATNNLGLLREVLGHDRRRSYVQVICVQCESNPGPRKDEGKVDKPQPPVRLLWREVEFCTAISNEHQHSGKFLHQ